ncbi:hypothetical protein V6N13_064335 [Hibiscus sabdariffa]
MLQQRRENIGNNCEDKMKVNQTHTLVNIQECCSKSATMGVPSCEETAGPRVHVYSWDRCNLVLFLRLSSSAPMLQRHVAHPHS